MASLSTRLGTAVEAKIEKAREQIHKLEWSRKHRSGISDQLFA